MTTDKKPWYQKVWVKIAALIGAVVLIAQLTGAIDDIVTFFNKYNQEEIQIVDPATSIKCESKKLNEFTLDTISPNPKYKTLGEFFVNANHQFFDSIEKRITEKNFIGITYLTSGAGSGKSFLVRKMIYNKCEVVKIVLPKIADRDKLNANHFEFLPDLETTNTDNNYTFNYLPALKNGYAFTFDSLLKWNNTSVSLKKPLLLVIDGIDEMHPKFSEAILNGVNDFLNRKKKVQRYSIQVVISCRPEGLKSYLVKERISDGVSSFIYLLKQPQFDRVADIKLFISDYNATTRGSKVDELSTLNNIIKSYQNNSSLLYNFGFLEMGNSVIELCSKMGYEKNEMYAKLRDNILSRNNEKMGRPNKDDKIYNALLKAIVLKYCGKADTNGFFEVGPKDEVTVIENGKRKFTVKVMSFLDRSGVAFVDPASFRTPNYKFEPNWLTELYGR